MQATVFPLPFVLTYPILFRFSAFFANIDFFLNPIFLYINIIFAVFYKILLYQRKAPKFKTIQRRNKKRKIYIRISDRNIALHNLTEKLCSNKRLIFSLLFAMQYCICFAFLLCRLCVSARLYRLLLHARRKSRSASCLAINR